MSDLDRIALNRWIAQNDAEAFREIVTRHTKGMKRKSKEDLRLADQRFTRQFL